MGVVKETGDRLAKFFLDVVPLPSGQIKGKKISPSLIEAGLQRFYQEARAVRDQNRLGIIGRARVARYVQQQLLVAGYAPDLVRQVLFSMLVSAFIGSKTSAADSERIT